MGQVTGDEILTRLYAACDDGRLSWLDDLMVAAGLRCVRCGEASAEGGGIMSKGVCAGCWDAWGTLIMLTLRTGTGAPDWDRFVEEMAHGEDIED